MLIWKSGKQRFPITHFSISCLVATYMLHKFMPRSQFNESDWLKKSKKLLKAESVQCKPGFVLAKFVYLSLDNVCILIEWVQLTSYSTSRGSYNKKVLLLIELNCVSKEMEHEKWFVTALVIYFFFILEGCTFAFVWVPVRKTMRMLLREGLVCQKWRVRFML